MNLRETHQRYEERWTGAYDALLSEILPADEYQAVRGDQGSAAVWLLLAVVPVLFVLVIVAPALSSLQQLTGAQ